MLRLVFGDQMGPAREVHAGSGYWSQDSAVQVMATSEKPTRIRARWPGGKVTMSEIPAGAREIALGHDGTIERLR